MPANNLSSLLGDIDTLANPKQEKPSPEQLAQLSTMLQDLEKQPNHPDYQVMKDEIMDMLSLGGITPKQNNLSGLDTTSKNPPVNSVISRYELLDKRTSRLADNSILNNSSPVLSSPPPLNNSINNPQITHQEFDTATKEVSDEVNRIRNKYSNRASLTNPNLPNPGPNPNSSELLNQQTSSPLIKVRGHDSPLRKKTKYPIANVFTKGASRLTGRY